MIKKHLPFALFLLAAVPGLAAPSDEPASPRPARSPNSVVMRYDTNKDGKLSKDELFARSPSAPGNVLPSDRQLERQEAFFRRNFARCDLDRDGRINTAECRQALRHQPVDRARQER